MPKPLSTPTQKTAAITSLFIAALCFASTAQADAITTLNHYLKTTKTGSANFTQTITNTNKKARSQTSTGIFAFRRPTQFKFYYQTPFENLIVADGKSLWTFDKDLNQVIQQDQAKVLQTTPVALVATANSVADLEKHFTLKNETAKDKLQWVKATPKQKEGHIRFILVGFDKKALRRLEIHDNFGQRSVMEFTPFTKLPANSSFSFTPPPAADVVRQ